ncbi:Rv0340 family protein [Mycolicibacterium mucogenicum]|uniref:Rv0340 family IniB-related protein n=1 Tax=Mycolicibacterium mucogenicum TaxID=56689 RepID=UPI00226A8F90|nr:Rv0340 family IniB-related protein [Mycolicibacterium mucogenicum]MCX8560213.1 Rv0340 family protein [Mycolicibacterium mucogenicum]
MANPLLDFVMSVVRDPDVAAHYAADPAGAIADANLSGVTTADVAHLIPVVSESLGAVSSAAGGVPTAGFDDPGVNVWTSGAATAAFDAFDAFSTHVPTVVSPQVISDPDLGGFDSGPSLPIHDAVPDLAVSDDLGLHSDIPVVDAGQFSEPDALDWHATDTADPSAGVEHHQGFDFFS